MLNIDGYSMEDSKLPWMSLSDWGWKAVVAAASDIAASGGRPVALGYSLGVPERGAALEVARGVGEAADWIGLIVGKNDVNRGSGWIDVAVVGVPGPRGAVSRKGARPGDLLLQVGYVGYGFVADLLLKGELSLDYAPREAIEYSRRPKPPIAAGWLLSSCGARASSDNSDGWLVTIASIAKASRVAVYLDEVLAPDWAWSLANGPDDLASSWEDYNLAIAAGEEEAECILHGCRRLGMPCEVVGYFGEGSGVYLKGRRVQARGWESL